MAAAASATAQETPGKKKRTGPRSSRFPTPSKRFTRTCANGRLSLRHHVLLDAIEPQTVPFVWIEAYDADALHWIPLDPKAAHVSASHPPPALVLAPDASTLVFSIFASGRIVDTTTRYLMQSSTFRPRMLFNWTVQRLALLNAAIARSETEVALVDLELASFKSQMMKGVAPLNIQYYKNHPMFALERHLKRNEIIRPKDPVLGWIKGEAIYPRESVQRLMAKEAWLRLGKVLVADHTEPAKRVPARKGAATAAGTEVLLYGDWQVKDYEPPTARNGKVPKNEFNNVYLFQPSMLPIGTVHLREPGMKRVLKALNLDFAEAVVGFEFSGAQAHVKIDGVVVCAEFEPAIKEAYEQRRLAELDEDLREKRARLVQGWKAIIKKSVLLYRFEQKYQSQK